MKANEKKMIRCLSVKAKVNICSNSFQLIIKFVIIDFKFLNRLELLLIDDFLGLDDVVLFADSLSTSDVH